MHRRGDAAIQQLHRAKNLFYVVFGFQCDDLAISFSAARSVLRPGACGCKHLSMQREYHMLLRKSSGTRLLRGMRRLGVPAAILLAGSLPLHAETLKEALTAAYLYNPTLKAARAQLRATDNNVSLAKSGYRPTVSAALQDGYENSRGKLAATATAPGYIPICVAPVRRFGLHARLIDAAEQPFQRQPPKWPVQSEERASRAAAKRLRRLPHL